MEHDVRELGELDLNKLILVVYEEIEDEELRAMIVSPGVHFNTNVMTDRIRLCFEAMIIAHWGFSKEVLTFSLMLLDHEWNEYKKGKPQYQSND
ncbi:MAG: hypothetical protein HOG80_12915 [Candidatus Marinimicrobia bacterium]|nr:hypothetical protein [Candidatus Neomarinimicrobiota bacterium]